MFFLVLGLLSNEGVEGVALRIEMLVESGMDNQALKAVSTVVLALISGKYINVIQGSLFCMRSPAKGGKK